MSPATIREHVRALWHDVRFGQGQLAPEGCVDGSLGGALSTIGRSSRRAAQRLQDRYGSFAASHQVMPNGS
jgi:hypothetical protein